MAGFPRGRRVRRSAEIRAIVAGGRTVEGPTLKVHAVLQPGSASPARAVVVVPGYGRGSVERNRVKRRLRELARLHLFEAPALRGGDFVIRARQGAYGRTFAELRDELLRLLERLSGMNPRSREGQC